MEKYFDGTLLYGDDFDVQQIEAWYREEEEGYANLPEVANYMRSYEYHEMNKVYGFEKVKLEYQLHALGLGSAFGHEFEPILQHLDRITIIEPSEQLRSKQIGGILATYVKPSILGTLAFPDNSFDVITCFGTLHHIPNVSYVMSELCRVAKPGAYLFIREPISSMGDWRKPRPGLTKNERGISVAFFDQMIEQLGLSVISKKLCSTGFLNKVLAHKLGMGRSRGFYMIDKFVSRLFSNNLVYHRTQMMHKLAPGSVFYVLSKPHR